VPTEREREREREREFGVAREVMISTRELFG